MVPTLMVTGTGTPVGIPTGSTTFTCNTPSAKPGAEPEERTVAGNPPTVAVTPNKGCASVVDVMVPVTPAGLVWPSPVPKRVTIKPALAGVDTDFTVKSSFRAAASEFGLGAPARKIPGAAATTPRVVALDGTLL